MVDKNAYNIDRESLEKELHNKLSELFDRYGDPFTLSFGDDIDEVKVTYLNGPSSGRVSSVVSSVYKDHGILLKELKHSRFFNHDGAKNVVEMWNDNLGHPVNGHYGAVGYHEVDVPSEISPDGKAYEPMFLEDYDGFKDDHDRRFWQIALNSVASVSELPKAKREIKDFGPGM